MDVPKTPKTPPPQNDSVPDRLIPIATPKKADSNSVAAIPNICLHVALKPEAHEVTPNVIIDFLKQAEEKYGFEKMHPDSRTTQDLLNDDDDVDVDDDNEDIDLMGGDNSAATTATGAATTTSGAAVSTSASTASAAAAKRSRVEGKYDLNDPFIDDSELQWEEQAASTKDGFFVYSGPLVQEGEQPQIERADGSIKKPENQSTTGAKKGPRKKKDESTTSSSATSTAAAAKRPAKSKAAATDKDGPSKKKPKTSTGPAKKPSEPKPKKEKEKKEPNPNAKMKQTKLTDKSAPAAATSPTAMATSVPATASTASPVTSTTAPVSSAIPLIPAISVSSATPTTAKTEPQPTLIPIAPKPTTVVVDLTDTPSPAKPPTPQQQARNSASIANLLI